MSRDKQIEEMAKDIAEAINHNSAVDVIRHGLICVNSEGITRELYDEGYRKQSEVERIFVEIDEAIDNLRGAFLRQRIAEIKREYGVIANDSWRKN